MKLFRTIMMATMLVFTAVTAHAQTKANWKEMHDFHIVMSKTFHPAEENNLAPLKKHASALVQQAKAWQQSKVPAGYDSTVTDPILGRLVKKAETIEGAVKAGKPDAELKKMITEAHDIFHKLMEKCGK